MSNEREKPANVENKGAIPAVSKPPVTPEEVVGVDEDEGPGVQELNQIMGASADEVRTAPKVKIMIHNQEGPTGNQPVFVSVNGMGYLIPRETVVIIPRPVLAALEDASELRYSREEKEGQQFGPVIERKVRRFPFTLMS